MFLKGRPLSLTVLDYGLFRVHGPPARDIGLMGALIVTDAGERVLVDSGLPAKYAADPFAAGEEDALHSFGQVLEIGAHNLPGAQMALCGVNEVDLMIQSHTHIDHIGGMFADPHVPMVVSSAERKLPKPLYWTGGQPWDWPERTYCCVEGDGQIGPGFAYLSCPGHAPGQLAFVIDLQETGRVIWTSDAISRPSEVSQGFAGSWDEEQALFHAKRLLTMEHDLVIYGHCPQQWKTLRKAPDYYS